MAEAALRSHCFTDVLRSFERLQLCRKVLAILTHSKLEKVAAPLAGPLAHYGCLVRKREQICWLIYNAHGNRVLVSGEHKKWCVCKAFTFKDAAQFEVLVCIFSAGQRNPYHGSPFSQFCAMPRFLARGSSGCPN